MKINKLIPNRENFHIYLFLGIIILGAFLRLYNFPNRMGFDFDASRDSLTASYYASKLMLPLTGGPSSVGPFHFGPWYYYGLIIFEKIFPIFGSWMFIELSSILCIFLIYKIGEELESRNFGLILSLLIAVSSSQIVLSTTLSNPSLIPPFAMGTILLSLTSLRKQNAKHFFLLGLVLGMGVSIHYQMFGLLIFPVFLLIWTKQKIKFITSALLGFAAAFIPILIFDLNNNWYDFKGLIFYLTQTHNNVYVANRWLFYLRDFWPHFWAYTVGLPIGLTVFLILFVFLVFVFRFKKGINKKYLLILISFAANLLLLRYFPAQKPIYYLYFLQGFIFIFTGLIVYEIHRAKKFSLLAIPILLGLIILMLSADKALLHTNNYFTQIISKRNEIIAKYPGQKLSLYTCREDDINKAMALAYLLNKKNLISASGNKIDISSSNHMTIKCINISGMSAYDIKELQFIKSY